jgi:hypothetical protein
MTPGKSTMTYDKFSQLYVNGIPNLKHLLENTCSFVLTSLHGKCEG